MTIRLAIILLMMLGTIRARWLPTLSPSSAF
jgi:hypothetical protein